MVQFVSDTRDAEVVVQKAGRATVIKFEAGVPKTVRDEFAIQHLRRLRFIREVE